MLSRMPLLLIYGGTGMTALAYEVLWTRMLSLMFGISIFGVVVTVAAFMAGLGFGAVFGMRLYHRLSASSALALLALLEALIALYALALPLLMPVLDQWVLYLGGGLSLAGWQGGQALAVLLLLVPAAMAMGLAFPLALRAAYSLRLSLGAMYGINAIGGAIGAVLPLALLPAMGWRSSLWLVALLGLGLAASAAFLSRRIGKGTDANAGRSGVRPPWPDLLAYAGVGAAALMLEVVWTREYGMILLRTEYVLGILLLVYLAGIGLGSMLARFLAPQRWLSLLPPVTALLAVGGQYLLPSISQWANGASFESLAQAMLLQGLAVLLCTLPVTLALGAWLPLLARRDGSESDTGGWWYGANSIGAALGVMLAGFVFLPWLGAATSLLAASVLLLLCGLRWASGRLIWPGLTLVLLLGWAVRELPPPAALLPSLGETFLLSTYEDAVALTHVVEQPDGQRLLLSDLQRMDASSSPMAVTVQKNQARLALLLHPAPRSVLFLGLGTGITAAGSAPYGDMLERTAVELSEGAIRAAADAFSTVNGQIAGHMRVVRDDARRFLRADRKSYDVIVGDLFHPDMVGRANLLSLQQFSRARQRLNDGGVFVQWLALNQFDVDSLRIVMHTFRKVFGHDREDQALLFIDGYRAALVGLRGDRSAAELIRKLARLPERARRQASGGEGLWTWLGRCWGRIPDLDDVRLQDEWAPVIEFTLPRLRYGDGMDMAALWRWLLSWRADAAKAADIWRISDDQKDAFMRAWASSGLDVRLWMAELQGDERNAVRWARLSLRANPQDRWPAFALADRMYESLQHGLPPGLDRKAALQKILTLRPDHEMAIRAMLKLARESGDAAAFARWRGRLQEVAPLAIDVRGG